VLPSELVVTAEELRLPMC